MEQVTCVHGEDAEACAPCHAGPGTMTRTDYETEVACTQAAKARWPETTCFTEAWWHNPDGEVWGWHVMAGETWLGNVEWLNGQLVLTDAGAEDALAQEVDF